MNMIKALLAISIATSSVAHAVTPKKVAIDKPAQSISATNENRIVKYTYSPEVIFRLFTLPSLHTHLELAEDEGLKENPVVGDSMQWRVSGGPRNIYIKPLREGIETSMTVVTTKRTYQFQLISGKPSDAVFQKVSFDYPDREAEIRLTQAAVAAVNNAEHDRLKNQIVAANIDPATLDFAYEVKGDASFKPTTVYSDGKFTYLRLPATQDSPAVFLIDESGSPSLINYTTKGNLIVVERVAQRLLLKLGSAEVKINKSKRMEW